MSSAVAICVILRAVWKYFTGLIIYVYTLGLIYILEIRGLGILQMPDVYHPIEVEKQGNPVTYSYSYT